MQHFKNFLLSRYKSHPLLYSLVLVFLFLLKDFVVEVHHKAITPLTTSALNTIHQHWNLLQDWLKNLYLLDGYTLLIPTLITALFIGTISISLRRTLHELNRLKIEKKQNDALHESDTIQGIRWRWEKGSNNHDIVNLQCFCPDPSCDGELYFEPYTKELPARFYITCYHCDKAVARRDYNYYTEDFTRAKEKFYDEIKREIRRRKRLKERITN